MARASGSGKDIYGEQPYGMANKVSSKALNPTSAPTMDIHDEADGRAKGDDMSPTGPESAE